MHLCRFILPLLTKSYDLINEIDDKVIRFSHEAKDKNRNM